MVSLALAAACLLVFGQVVRHNFINLDDNSYVSQNLWVRSGFSWAGIAWAFTSIDFFYWQPLTWLSHMLDCQLFGLNAGWHHLTNLLLHVANTLLVFVLFRRLTGAFWRSALLAALFGLHPSRIESVAWIAERKDLLSGFWLLVTIWAYVRFATRPSQGRYLLVLASLTLGLMSKPMLVTVPFLLLLLDYWPLRRTAVAEKLPMLALAAASSFLTYVGTSRLGAVNWGAAIPLGRRLANAVLSCARYVGLALWPGGLAIHYPYPDSIPWWKLLGAAVFLAGITIAVLWFGRRRRYLVVGWLWFVVGLVPVIGLVQVGRQAMADRFTYIPFLGLFLAAVWGIADLPRERRGLAAALAGGVVLACGVATWSHVRVWRDSVAVFTDALAVTRNNSIAHHYLAAALEERGRFDEALPHHAEAVRIQPSYFIAQGSYGLALERRGDAAGAAAHFSEAVRYFPGYAEAHYHLGMSLARLGRTAEAEVELKKALDIGLADQDVAPARQALEGIRPANRGPAPVPGVR
jgi:tetratricopeptide (TPR) repeat protein